MFISIDWSYTQFEDCLVAYLKMSTREREFSFMEKRQSQEITSRERRYGPSEYISNENFPRRSFTLTRALHPPCSYDRDRQMRSIRFSRSRLSLFRCIPRHRTYIHTIRREIIPRYTEIDATDRNRQFQNESDMRIQPIYCSARVCRIYILSISVCDLRSKTQLGNRIFSDILLAINKNRDKVSLDFSKIYNIHTHFFNTTKYFP